LRVRRFFRITYYFGGVLVFIVIALIGFTQTRSFKAYLRDEILNNAHSALTAHFQLGAIEGNLVTGISLHDVRVTASGVDLFSAERIELRYDPLAIFFKRIGVSNAVIINPRIFLYRSTDGRWNVERLAKPLSTDTIPSAWSVDVKRVELANAEVVVTDSLRLLQRQRGEREQPPDSVIDYARIHLSKFDLIASLRVQNDDYAASIRQLRFISRSPPFALSRLTGDFLLSRSEVSARDVEIETPSSHLRIDAAMKDLDLARIASLGELRTKPLSLSLKANELSTKELKQFLYPWVDFLNKEFILTVEAGGTFGDLHIEKAVVQTARSLVQLQGTMTNLHHPADLEMDLRGIDNTIAPQDLLDHLPGLHLPDLTSLGPVVCSLQYRGKPKAFKARVESNSAAGGVDLDAAVAIDPQTVTYNGTVTTRSLALGTVLQNKKLASDLNIRATIDGSGSSPLTMTGLARVNIDSSSINGMPMENSVFIFDIADGILRFHAIASVGTASCELSNESRFFPGDSIRYSLNGRIRSADFARILQDNKYSSDVSFDLDAFGFVGPSVRSDTVNLHFLRSTIGTEIFDGGDANAVFVVRAHRKSELSVRSKAADIDVRGDFAPASFINAWQYSLKSIGEAVERRISSLDSIYAAGFHEDFTEKTRMRSGFESAPLDARYRFQVKDFRLFGAFFQVPLEGQGLLEGELACDTTSMRLDASLSLEQLGLKSGSDTLAAETVSVQCSMENGGDQMPPMAFSASIGGNLRNFKFNNLLLNRIALQFSGSPDSSKFQVSALIDSAVHLAVDGSARFYNHLVEVELAELNTDMGGYIARAPDTVRFVLGSDGFRIQPFTIRHDSEQVTLRGYFSPKGSSEIALSLEKFALGDLKQILHRTSYGRSSTQFNGTVNTTLLFRGNLEHPEFSADMLADSVRADDFVRRKHTTFGRIESHCSYAHHVLSLLVEFLSHPDDPHAMPDLLFSGTLPFEGALAYEKPHRLEGDVDLAIRSTGMSLEFFEPFIPELSNLTGTMTCDMRMKGPLDAPLYEGSMSIRNATFLFKPLGLRYIMNGELIPAGDKIRLENFTIQNVPQEKQHVGTMLVSGSFTLSGLSLKTFDLLTNGDLKIMSEENRWPGQKLYGNLFVGTGPNGLSWQGSLSASMVRGTVYIKDAELVLPPEHEPTSVRADAIHLSFVDDTARQVERLQKPGRRSFGSEPAPIDDDTLRNGSIPALASQSAEASFLDAISYDISIETKGPTQLRFVFNTQTSEELFADLQGHLFFNKTSEASRLTGQVDVGNRSYYRFIKEFEATGKLLFTGSVFNPELDITASYQGTHRETGSDTTDQVQVTLQITGTRNEPKTKILLATKAPSETDWKEWDKGDEEANAISFILSGQYRDELTDQQRMNLIGTNLGFALASGMLTGPLSEAIRRNTWGYIQSVDVIYTGGQFKESADVRLTGQIGEAVIRAGGRVLNDWTNANVSVELPVSSIVKSDQFRNLIITLEHRVEGVENIDEQRRASNGARLYYRIVF
jgi:hypothetical protein